MVTQARWATAHLQPRHPSRARATIVSRLTQSIAAAATPRKGRPPEARGWGSVGPRAAGRDPAAGRCAKRAHWKQTGRLPSPPRTSCTSRDERPRAGRP